MYTFNKKGDNSIKYKLQFGNMYEENSSGQKVGGTNVNMNACDWDIVKDTTDQNSFVMTTTNKTSCDIPCTTLRFNNTLNGLTNKFDVIMENTALSTAAAFLVIEWKLTKKTDGGTETDGTDPSTNTNTQVCYPGSGDGEQVCFSVASTATAGSRTVNVELDFDGGFVKMKYEKFSGNLFHDPEFGTYTKKKCFSGANTVEVEGQGIISMQDLKIGDMVKTSHQHDHFSRVYSFAHIDRETETEFLQIYAQDLKTPLEITTEHFLSIGSTDKKLVRAKDVQVGDLVGHKSQVITKIASVQRRGFYAPITESGEILVSGISASCYASLLDVEPEAQAFATHSILSPLRLACSVDFSFCQNESYSDEGYSTYLTGMIHGADLLSTLNPFVQTMLLSLSIPLMISLIAFESFLTSGLVVVALAISGVIVALLGKKSRTAKSLL
jgi:hypothetical protein